MGVLINDMVEIGNLGISIAGFVISIRGSFEIAKENGVYHIRARAFWTMSGATLPIKEEMINLDLAELPANIYTAIYEKIKLNYQDWTDI